MTTWSGERFPRLVIFDMGGTTVNLDVNVANVFEESFRAHGITIAPTEVVAWRGASKREAVAGLLDAASIVHVDATMVYDTFQSRLFEALTRNRVHAIAGSESVFSQLRSAGMIVFLSTGFDAGVTRAIVEMLGWDEMTDGIVTGDDVAKGRPSPDMIWHAMRKSGVTSVDDVVVVGDTVNDIEAGRRAGVEATVGVLTGAHDAARLANARPAAILQSVAAFPAWLGLTSD